MNPPILLLAAPAEEPIGHFYALDWIVLVGYIAMVSVLGVVLAGKQKDMRDFFRGGDKLPWYAVSASLIATTVSAVTFVGVPAVAFTGDMTYLQLGIIAGLISRLFISFVLVPAYYEKRVYSPYDYMGDRLGGGAKGVTTALFTLGGLLAQSARVYLTALVLTLVMAEQLAWVRDLTGLSPLASSIIIIGLIAVAWTMLGGIATVVWTDALLFLVFVTGGVAALWVILAELPGGWSQYVEVGRAAEKFKIFNIDQAFSLTEPYTLAAAGFAVVVGNIGVYGTDQLLAQRIFCCKNQRHAQYAMLSSYAAELVTTLMLLVGVGLFVFYSTFPERLSGTFAARVAEENDKIFPAFILQQMPVGVTGLVIAGIFAAAISSLTSILAALAQTSVSALYVPARLRKLGLTPPTADSDDAEQALLQHDPAEGRRIVNVSRVWIVFWGVALCLAAFVVDAFKDATGVPILDLALALASYIVGGLFAAFLLAWLPLKINGRGLVWAAPLGVLAVFACRFHDTWAIAACGVGTAALLITWLARAGAGDPARRPRRLARTPWLALGCVLVLLIAWRGYFHVYDDTGNVVLAYPEQRDEQGQRILDPDADPITLNHPITGQSILDATGQPLRASDAKQTALLDTSAGQPQQVAIAWPWYAPIGGVFAFVLGYLLADRKPTPAPPPPASSPARSL